MAYIDAHTGELVLRIVYDGPAHAGKTTNVRLVHERVLAGREGVLESPGSEGRATEFFDFRDFAGGLLDGLRCTTHYGSYELLAESAPRTTVVRGVRYVDNGRVICSAGVQAGMDMSLHVVARLCGLDVARETARYIEYEWSPDTPR